MIGIEFNKGSFFLNKILIFLRNFRTCCNFRKFWDIFLYEEAKIEKLACRKELKLCERNIVRFSHRILFVFFFLLIIWFEDTSEMMFHD